MRKVDDLQRVLFAGLIGLLIPLKGFAGPHKEIDLRTMTEATGEYDISLCARTSPSGPVPGHAFVVYSHRPPGKERKILAVGFTTSSGPVQAALSYKGWLTKADGYLGEERYTSVNERCLLAHVDKKVFEQAWSFAHPFVSIPGLNDLRWTGAYTLAQNDCMTFMSSVADLLKGVKVPTRGATELPLAYLRRLIDLN